MKHSAKERILLPWESAASSSAAPFTYVPRRNSPSPTGATLWKHFFLLPEGSGLYRGRHSWHLSYAHCGILTHYWETRVTVWASHFVEE